MFSRFANGDADFDDCGHVTHENDWTIEGYMIEDDEGFLQWNAQQSMENNYPEENNEYGYIDDYYCMYCVIQ